MQTMVLYYIIYYLQATAKNKNDAGSGHTSSSALSPST